MDTVKIHIHRKRAFAGGLLSYRLHINGEFVGTLKNGKTLDAIIPRAKKYYINEAWSFDERNGFFDDDGSEAYTLVIKRAGGWRTDSYNKFYIRSDDKTVHLPSFHYDKLFSAIYHADEFAKLNACEKTFARCLEFENAIRDDMDALLCNKHYHEMLEAVKEVGAKDIYEAVTSFAAAQFSPDIELPFVKSPDSYYYRSTVADGNNLLKECRKNGTYEAFHKCLVRYLTSQIL